MPRQTVLRTERLVLTTWLPEDLEALYELHSDPLTMRWVRRGRPETLAETEELLTTYLQEQATRGWTKWRVVTDHDGPLVGRAGFGASGDGRELGYTLTRGRWGQGHCTRSRVPSCSGIASLPQRPNCTRSRRWTTMPVDGSSTRPASPLPDRPRTTASRVLYALPRSPVLDA